LHILYAFAGLLGGLGLAAWFGVHENGMFSRSIDTPWL
jgi:hypothetical protein